LYVSQFYVNLSFQIRSTALVNEGHVDVAKKIILRARLCATGCGSTHELGNIKTAILCTKADGNCIPFAVVYGCLRFSLNSVVFSHPSYDNFRRSIYYFEKLMNMVSQVFGGVSLLRSLQP
jgi:hypothetical protein